MYLPSNDLHCRFNILPISPVTIVRQRPAYFPFLFGFHSLANRCASSIWKGVILGRHGPDSLQPSSGHLYLIQETELQQGLTTYGLNVVLLDTLASSVHISEVVLACGTSLIGCLTLPLHCDGVFLLDALAILIHDTKVELGPGVFLLCQWLEQAIGSLIVTSVIRGNSILILSPASRGCEYDAEKESDQEGGGWLSHVPPHRRK